MWLFTEKRRLATTANIYLANISINTFQAGQGGTTGGAAGTPTNTTIIGITTGGCGGAGAGSSTSAIGGSVNAAGFGWYCQFSQHSCWPV